MSDHASWINHISLTSVFDYNVVPANASYYGEGIDYDRIRRYMQTVRPDLFLVHSRGFWGWGYYPSKFIPAPPNMREGVIETMKQICDEEGVRFGFSTVSWMHSGGNGGGKQPFCQGLKPSEEELERYHARNHDGSLGGGGWTFYCVNSPWIDEVFNPFLLENIERYNPEAYWFDHDHLAIPCWCKYCQQKYEAEHNEPMPAPGIDGNATAKLQQFLTKSFTEAKEKINDTIHGANPRIAVAWKVHDTHLFDPVPRGTDWFCSDEINGCDLRRAQVDMAHRSICDIAGSVMIPSVSRDDAPRHRPAAHTLAECASLMAHGLSLTIYDMPPHNGTMHLDHIANAEIAAEFIRERGDFCIGNDSVANVAALSSYADQLRLPSRICPQLTDLPAVHSWLAESHIPCEVGSDHSILPRLARYDLVILPECRLIAPNTAQALEDYVQRGGTIFVVGAAPRIGDATEVSEHLSPIFGLTSREQEDVACHFDGSRRIDVGRLLETDIDAEVLWRRTGIYDEAEQEPLLLRIARGSGAIYWFTASAITEYGGRPPQSLLNDLSQESLDGGTGAGLGSRIITSNTRPPKSWLDVIPKDQPEHQIDYYIRPYKDPMVATPHPNLRYLMGQAFQEALGDRWLLRSPTSPGVHFVLNRRGSDLYVHLVNHTVGYQPEGGYCLFDNIPVLADVSFELHLPIEATAITALPAHDGLYVEWTGTSYRVTLAKLHYHTAVKFAGAADALRHS